MKRSTLSNVRIMCDRMFVTIFGIAATSMPATLRLNILPKAWIAAEQYTAAKIICDNASNRMRIVEAAMIKVYVLTTGGFQIHDKITSKMIER